MAIKGKSRPKARRGVTSGPRAAYVHVKRPLAQRRSFQLGVLGAIVVVSLGAITYGVLRVRSEQRADELDERMRATMDQYSSVVEPALAGVGQSVPPGGFELQAALQQAIDAFRAGDIEAADVRRSAERYAQDADETASTLADIDVAELTRGKGFGAGFVRDLFSATSEMRSGLLVHAEAARLLAEAALLDGPDRERLLDRATAVGEIGSETFLGGYRGYVNAQAEAGTFQGGLPFQPPGSGRD
jgi:hypothetical protein